MTEEFSQDTGPIFPMEIWSIIFSYLPPQSLHTCKQVCSNWRKEVLYMIETGRIPSLGLKCTRLEYDPKAVNEHRRPIWDTISFCVDQPILLVGVSVYAPSGESVVCVDARPIEPNLRPIDVSTELESRYEDDDQILTVYGTPATKKPVRFRIDAGVWWEVVLNIRPIKTRYDDCGTVWSASGQNGKQEVIAEGVRFQFMEIIRDGGWRSNLNQVA